MKILIVDDSPLFLSKIICNIDMKIEVHKAFNGREGLDKFNDAMILSEAYDIVFLDLDMPVMRGESMLHAVRSYENASQIDNVTIIVISANHSVEKVLELYEIGCDYYIKKPYGKKEIQNAINSAIKAKSF